MRSWRSSGPPDVYFLVDHRGLTVAEATELRTRLRAVGASLKVVKNTLAKRAAAEAGVVEAWIRCSKGPTAIAFCHADPVAAAKALQAFIREKKKLTVKGGYLQRRILHGRPGGYDGVSARPRRAHRESGERHSRTALRGWPTC